MAIACLPMAGVAASMVRHRKRGRLPRRVQVTPRFRDDGIAMADGIVVSRAQDAPLAVLSASCTHLGCRVSRVDDGLLVCPCHGSRFHRDGSVAGGPATQALAQLDFTVDASTGTISVDLD